MALFLSDVVCCDVCHCEEKVTAQNDFPKCRSKNTICNNRLLLPKLMPGRIFVTRNCDCNAYPWYQTIEEDTMTFKCSCSNEFKIVHDRIAEVRCNQIVYSAALVVPHKEIIEKLREDLKSNAEEKEKLKVDNDKLKDERDEIKEEMRKTKMNEQLMANMEKTLEEKNKEIQFLRNLVNNSKKEEGPKKSFSVLSWFY